MAKEVLQEPVSKAVAYYHK